MKEFHTGQEFVDIDSDEFARINNAANKIGLMAFITLIRDTDDGKLISFYLRSQFNA